MPRSKLSTRQLIGAAFVAAVTSAAIMSSTGTANAIANGTAVPDGQYSFSTKLTMTGIPNPDGTKRDSACSGALIAPAWIVTAGHCFHDVNGNRVSGPTPYATTATVGRTDLSSANGHVVDVVEVQQAPVGDVALGRLASPVTDVTPLPMAASPPTAGAILRLTGWGATSSVNPVSVTHLMTGQVKAKRVNSTSVLVVGYAPSRKTSACLWDSGAPYFSESSGGTVALVSVESDGPPCPHSQEETTTRIDRNADWIRQTIAQPTPAPIRRG